jgi:hypothetical protein
MRETIFRLVLCGLLFAAPALADTVILRDGASYSGQFTSAPSGEISFTDTQGVQYKFPVRDVQSLVFSSTTDRCRDAGADANKRSGKCFGNAGQDRSLGHGDRHSFR